MKLFNCFILSTILIISCKKQDSIPDAHFTSANYYINDSLVGKTDYSYDDSSHLLLSETTHLYGNRFVRHLYAYFNDSIVANELIFNGTDSIHNQITIFTTGNERLVMRIRIFNQDNLIISSDRYYNYGLTNQLQHVDYFSGTQLFDFNYTINNISSYKLLFPRLLPPYGNDTIQVAANYTTFPYQAGINNFLLVNMFNLISSEFQTMNLELAGCTFNTADNLMSSLTFLPTTLPDYTYQYTFDVNNRVSTKTLDYVSPVELPPNQLYKVVYIYSY